MKPANRNLLLLGIPALLILLAGIFLFLSGELLFRTAQLGMPEAPGSDVGDVEGYAYLLGFFGSGFGQLAALAVQIFAVLLAVYGGVMIALSTAARLVYRLTPGRILAYRIVVGVNLALMLLPVPALLDTFWQSLVDLSPRPGLLLPVLFLALPSAFAIRTTYTRRIGTPAARTEP